jgi:hypothetical protein
MRRRPTDHVSGLQSRRTPRFLREANTDFRYFVRGGVLKAEGYPKAVFHLAEVRSGNRSERPSDHSLFKRYDVGDSSGARVMEPDPSPVLERMITGTRMFEILRLTADRANDEIGQFSMEGFATNDQGGPHLEAGSIGEGNCNNDHLTSFISSRRAHHSRTPTPFGDVA